MREGFSHFLPPDEDYWDRVASHGTYAFDTNVLLNFYRFSDSTRDELRRAIDRLGERRWIPHQVATEFHTNRYKVRLDLLAEYKKATAAVDAAAKAIKEGFPKEERHPYLASEIVEELGAVLGSLAALKEKVGQISDGHNAATSGSPSDDWVGEDLFDLFDGRVGPPFEADRQNAVAADAKARFKEGVPPGFEDTDKPDGGHGDLIIWYQLIDRAIETSEPVLFVTDDGKRDWLWRAAGKTIGPRSELVQEMAKKAGVRFHLQSVAQFLTTSNSSVLAQEEAERVALIRSSPGPVSPLVGDAIAVRRAILDVVSRSLPPDFYPASSTEAARKAAADLTVFRSIFSVEDESQKATVKALREAVASPENEADGDTSESGGCPCVSLAISFVFDPRRGR
jgi:hypothetical protein